MKKLILAGIVIIIGCLIFIIIQQNSSQADIGGAMFKKPYVVPFGDWVQVSLSAQYGHLGVGDKFSLEIVTNIIEVEGQYWLKYRFKVLGYYYADTEVGKLWYQKTFPAIKEAIRHHCRRWTLQGYPISLNDFEFDIKPYAGSNQIAVIWHPKPFRQIELIEQQKTRKRENGKTREKKIIIESNCGQ